VGAANAERARAGKAISTRMHPVDIEVPPQGKADPRMEKLRALLPRILYQADMHTTARSGWMQSGGAIGGRDQIQTFINRLVTGTAESKTRAKEHLKWMARHQFGDPATPARPDQVPAPAWRWWRWWRFRRRRLERRARLGRHQARGREGRLGPGTAGGPRLRIGVPLQP
jgi:hypothetical protein